MNETNQITISMQASHKHDGWILVTFGNPAAAWPWPCPLPAAYMPSDVRRDGPAQGASADDPTARSRRLLANSTPGSIPAMRPIHHVHPDLTGAK
jgi:hypothetical protein